MCSGKGNMSEILKSAVQINNGFTDTSADGANLYFDKKYGIMFCAYMPGPQGHYGESRGRIALSYFPASQPTNIRFRDIACGDEVYVPNLIGLGEGRVRVLYERNSRADCDHTICYKDFDMFSETLTEEKTVMLKREDGEIVPLCESEQYAYLRKRGFTNQIYKDREQITICGHTITPHTDGKLYGAISSFYAEPILYRSADNMETVEFFAICPHPAQYEFDYKFLGDKIYAIGRTDKDRDTVYFTVSSDMGKTWSVAKYFENSIQCKPKIMVYNNHILTACNFYNPDTGSRPDIQQGRTEVKLFYGENEDPNQNTHLLDLHSPYGIVNISLVDILGDIYMAYSTSELALEYQNGNPLVRGKDAIRFVKLGDLVPKGN